MSSPRPVQPKLSEPLGGNRIVLPPDARLQCRHRDGPGAVWSDYADVAGREIEFRIVPRR